MKIIVFGARGDVGSRVVKEALSRHHAVTGVVRNERQVSTLPDGATPQVADAAATAVIREMMAEHDVAISAIRPPDGQEDALVPLTRSILDAAANAAKRVVIVGGAASLKMPDNSGNTVLTAPDFLPDSVVPIARACQAQYELCLSEGRAAWAYLCPPAMLTPGVRTGHYRRGNDALLVSPEGTSAISMEDFAVALIDEVETPLHVRARFTVAA
ncbi:NAD(P)H-binding protein [Roseobacter sp. YSTF-M11]|uniref:NAD(P)H-binding protein n=1 Tax=Roseobacter insulae TaxID=2859783 RepID=A0A9X1FUI6_9RHOB|nr:NAD(P)H-binding protein [Roseobacter insulae]MBW4707644.1 NAD(P)H-binding protein [Roseobacter insulae]